MHSAQPPIFHGIYFIHAHTGSQLISKHTPNITFDVDLITGMFNALESFINHLAYSSQFETLQDINFQGLSLIYERYGESPHSIMCVGVCDRNKDTKHAHEILQKLVRDFYFTYAPEIRKFRGNVRPFQHFLPYIQMVFESSNKIMPIYQPLSPELYFKID